MRGFGMSLDGAIKEKEEDSRFIHPVVNGSIDITTCIILLLHLPRTCGDDQDVIRRWRWLLPWSLAPQQ